MGDQFIELLSHLVEDCQEEPRIWLQVDGVYIGGCAISALKYSDEFRKKLKPKTRKHLDEEAAVNTRLLLNDPQDFIHLKEATFSTFPEMRSGIAWRVPVSQITGIGFLEAL